MSESPEGEHMTAAPVGELSACWWRPESLNFHQRESVPDYQCPVPRWFYLNSKPADMLQKLELELFGYAPDGTHFGALESMFELIALWMIVGLFCTGFWLVVSAS